MVPLAGKSPNIRSYTVYICGSGQPYECVCRVGHSREFIMCVHGAGQSHVYAHCIWHTLCIEILQKFSANMAVFTQCLPIYTYICIYLYLLRIHILYLYIHNAKNYTRTLLARSLYLHRVGHNCIPTHCLWLCMEITLPIWPYVRRQDVHMYAAGNPSHMQFNCTWNCYLSRAHRSHVTCTLMGETHGTSGQCVSFS
jgi:hypothetical protein